jgi:TetR/AcrR family transcriptional repressor of mexJK operon
MSNWHKRFFERPDIRAQLRDDLDIGLLPIHLLNCVIGDFYSRMLFEPVAEPRAQVLGDLEARLDLFYRSVLRNP